MYDEVLKPVFVILLSVIGFAFIHASLMALSITSNQEEEDSKGWDWKVWADLWTPIFTSYHSARNFRRNWWTMRGPSVLVIVGFGLLISALLLWKFT